MASADLSFVRIGVETKRARSGRAHQSKRFRFRASDIMMEYAHTTIDGDWNWPPATGGREGRHRPTRLRHRRRRVRCRVPTHIPYIAFKIRYQPTVVISESRGQFLRRQFGNFRSHWQFSFTLKIFIHIENFLSHRQFSYFAAHLLLPAWAGQSAQ